MDVHKALRLQFGVTVKTLTACGFLAHSPPEGDASYKWPDVTCPKCKALEPAPSSQYKPVVAPLEPTATRGRLSPRFGRNEGE
jgi:hypothetical protein